MCDAYVPEGGEPLDWIIAFSPTSKSRFVRIMAFGKFKHVFAFAYHRGVRAWVTFDVGITGTRITVIPDDKNLAAVLGPWIDGCTLVKIRKVNPAPARLPMAGWCVPAVRRLLGIPSGALRPDAFYRHCLANGGEIIDAREHTPATG